MPSNLVAYLFLYAMNLVENSTWNFDINGKPALNALGELEAELARVKKSQEDLKRGTQEWTDSKKEVKELEAEIKKVREEMGNSGMTVKQLEAYAKQLNREIKDLTPGMDDYIEKTTELKDVNDRLANVRKDIRGVADDANAGKSVWEQVKVWVASAFTISAILEAGQMVKQFFSDGIENFKKFDAASKELSANTQIVGKDLDYLNDQAKQLGPQMGKTGDEMLAAYQAMGSAKSDLTENAASLAAVTKEAIILSQAGKLDLAPATELMAGALNQFNAPASDAGRFINAIAAGAQVGSAEIDDMTGALKASGTVANAAGVSFEQTNGALQSLSTINIKGEQAGTAFRNVLIKMMSSSEDLNPQIVGLDKAMENLGKRNMSTAELAKMFGTENVVAAQHLVTHREQVKEFTAALTGTDAAYVMAAKNNDTLEFKQKQYDASIVNTSVKLGEILSPIMKGFYGMMIETGLPVIEKTIQIFAALAKGIMEIPAFISENKEAFIALGVALVSLNAANIAATASSIGHAAAEKARVIWTESGTIAQWALNAALTANPIGVVVAAVALFVGGLITLYKNVEGVRNVVDALWEGMKKAATAVGNFFGMVSDENNKSLAQQKSANDKHLSDKAANEKKTAAQIAADANATTAAELATKNKQEEAARQAKLSSERAAHKKELEDKEKAAEALRKSEEAKAKAAAEKEAADKIVANAAANKAIEKASIDAIADELTRKKAQLAFELNEKLAANTKSKADDLVKVEYEISLRNQYKTAVEKFESDYRAKHVAEETKRINEIAKLEDAQRNERQNKEKATQKTILDTQLSNEKLSISQRQALKIQLIELEKKMELERIEEVAAKERAKVAETSAQLMKLAGDDAAKKKQIETDTAASLRSIDDNRIAQTNAANAAHQAALKTNEATTLAERQANQQGFFSAIKSLMTGDFAGFMDFLNKKLGNEKAMNDERLQNWTAKGAEILSGVAAGLQMMQKLSEARLQKELSNITKEKDTQLKSWKEKYDKGLISKEDYEEKIDDVNQQALEREHEAKVKAWKREQKMQIGMVLINAAMAALKSLAMMGFPLGLIGVVASAALAAVQIGIIKSQSPPSMAKGGYIRNAGVPQGPRHGQSYGQSGISLTNRETGEEVGEMEGDEPIMILSRNTYKNNRVMINALLDSSLHKNGAPIHAEKGSVFGGDGGDYRSLLEPLRKGESYLFGSKKRKMEADAKNQANVAAYEAEQQQKELDEELAAAQASADSGANAGGGYDEGMNPYGDVEGGDADATNGATSAEIGKSQQMMATIGKNTAATAQAVSELKPVLDSINGKMDQLIGATNRAGDGSWAAAGASNRAADAVGMAARNNL